MDIATQIVTAIVAGAAVAGKDVANQAIKDAYGALKEGMRVLLNPSANTAIAKIESDPASAEAREELKEAIGEPGQDDINALKDKLDVLLGAIASDKRSREVVSSQTLNINLSEIDRFVGEDISAQDFNVVDVDINNVKDMKTGAWNFQAAKGN